MTRIRWAAWLVGAAAIFAAGYGAGAVGDVVGALRKQPATMLDVGVADANAVFAPHRVTIEASRFVVTMRASAPFPGPSAAGFDPKKDCPLKLDQLRLELGVRYDKLGNQLGPSRVGRSFVPAVERTGTGKALLEHLDAIDRATLVRVEYGHTYPGCEGPLLVK